VAAVLTDERRAARAVSHAPLEGVASDPGASVASEAGERRPRRLIAQGRRPAHEAGGKPALRLRVDKAGRGRHDPRVRDLATDLAAIDAAGLRRRLRTVGSAADPEITVDGRPVLLFCSNNYLGLATHPALRRAAIDALERWGCGTGSSRLISGHTALHAAVEARLAAFKGTEAALLFPSGYQANVGAITALVGRGDHVFSDALNHASIVDGCRLARATVHVYPHADVGALEATLAATPPGGRRLVVTDSVFSMDGDRAPLAEIVRLAEAHDALVMVDEAHATGVLGPSGAGLASALGLADRIAVHMGTLGKALGGAGAYVAGSRALVDLLVNRARSFVFTTALPPATVAAAGAALDVVVAEPERRECVLAHAARLRAGLRVLGFDVRGDTQIVPVCLGGNARAVEVADRLLAAGVLATAIRPPTVPEGSARIRVTPMATHTAAHIDRALEAFARAAGTQHAA
jgi:8-amino-7-oxononanoate synthase